MSCGCASAARCGTIDGSPTLAYDLNRRTAIDNPAADGTFPPFEDFQQQVFQASWFIADGQVIK